jgi:hypothetical protein
MARLTRPNGDELSGISSIVDMLAADHRRNTNQITFLPGMSRALVKVITPALHHQQKLLENMTVLGSMPEAVRMIFKDRIAGPARLLTATFLPLRFL